MKSLIVGAIRGTSLAVGLFTPLIWIDICRLNQLAPISSDGLAFLLNLLLFIGIAVAVVVLLVGVPWYLTLMRGARSQDKQEISRGFIGITFALFYLAFGGITLLNYGVYFDDFPITLGYWSARLLFGLKMIAHLLVGYVVYKIYVVTARSISLGLREARRSTVLRYVVELMHSIVYAVIIQIVILFIYGLANGGSPLKRIEQFLLGSRTSQIVPATVALPESDSPPSTKVVLLAIDGAGWRAIDKLMAEEQLPTFRYLKESGSVGYLNTFKPTSSPLIWSTVATGVSPERHGISGYIQFYFPGVSRPLFLPLARGLNRYFSSLSNRFGLLRSTPVLSTARRVKAIWEVVDLHNGSSGVFNWWPSRPVDDISGFMISDHAMRSMAHLLREGGPSCEFDAQDATPPEFYAAVSESRILTDLSPLESEVHLLRSEGRPDNIVAAFNCLCLTSRIAMALGLFVFKGYFPHLTAVYVADTDNHYHWEYMEPEYFGNVNMNAPEAKIVRNIYIAVDRIIEEFVKNMDERTTLVIVSDHSIRPVLWERPFAMTGSHANAPPGIIIMYGNGVRSGYRIEDARVFDVAPTVLALLGIPIPEDVEGKPLTDALTEEFKESFPIRRVPSYGPREVQEQAFPESAVDQEFIEKLKQLGYIE